MAKKSGHPFTLSDRMAIVQLLPSEGKFEDLIAREDIISKCRITSKEVDEYEIQTLSDGKYVSTQWNSEKVGDKVWEYEFSSIETELIKKVLKKASEEERLNVSQINLYKLFCV